jgi:DNA-binding HxlR family transcriptional regulator
MSVPQIRCPNCGLTINLENRKDTDVQLITTAVQHDASSFTELLRSTKLPRKTLSLRLKEMCSNGVLAKVDGAYKLNGTPSSEKKLANPFGRVANVVGDRRVKGLILIGLVLMGFPVVSYALATLFSYTPTINVASEPKLSGNFSLTVEVHDMKDLYAWQAIIAFNTSELKLLEITPGEDFNVTWPYFLTPSDLGHGMMLVGASLEGASAGVNIPGAGSLAVIVFGYYASNYQSPKIIRSGGGFETELLDSQQQDIPLSDSTLSLAILP